MTTWPARALLGLVGQPAFEQLGIGEDDAELIVQPVEQTRQIRLGSGSHTRSADRAHALVRRHG